MNCLHSVGLFLLLLCLSAFAVTGVVVDGSRFPLQNVTVSFQDDSAITTTDENGQFTLQPQATKNLDAGQVNSMVSVVNGLIHVSLPEITNVSMSTVDLNGRVMYQMGEHLALSGDYDPLGGRAVPAGIYFVRYQAGSVYGVLTLSISESGRIHSSTRVDPVLKKTAEGTEDSLALEKSGYGSRTVAVADYAQDLDTLVLIWCGFANDCGTFTDSRDGHEYRWITIGSQTWMAENLAYLPSVNAKADSSSSVANYYVYDYDGVNIDSAKASSNYATYGVLYNYSAALTACPSGWHLPSDDEWRTLVDSVGGDTIAGQKLKSISGWTASSGITNEDAYGFSALPGGYYYGSDFHIAGYFGYWLSATQVNATSAYYWLMYFDADEVNHIYDTKDYGFSVRCVQGASSSSVVVPSSSSSIVVVSSSSSVVPSSSSVTTSGIFSDGRDNHSYKWTKIGTQTWMAENLAYLPSVNTKTDSSYTVAKYYVYDYSGTSVSAAKVTSNYSTYGVLYNYSAALTACPSGWHLPDTTEWNTLVTYVGGNAIAGQKLKSASGWTAASGITNEDAYGFSALPGGYYSYGSGFDFSRRNGFWWTSTPNGSSYAYSRDMHYTGASVFSANYRRGYGFSVRCIQD